jgi:hypothetical protein
MENYTAETIEPIARKIAELLQPMIEQASHIGDIEQELRKLLQTVGQTSLKMLLEQAGQPQAKEMTCECGGVLHYRQQRAATVITVCGRVTYERAYYSGCKCGKGCAPLDERLHLQPGAVTPGLANLLALSGIQFSHERSRAWLQEFLLFDVSANTIRKETERMGKLQEELEQEWVAQSQDPAWLQARQRQELPAPETLYCAIDAAKARTEPRKQPKPPHEDWRDVKTLVWFHTRPVSEKQRTARERRTGRQEAPLRAIGKQYACAITEAEAFGKLLWATGCQANADRAKRLVMLGDGAPWIWNLVQTHFPHAVQIVDWYHAEEHLETVARAAYSDPQQQQAWLDPLRQALWEGQVEEVIQACQSLACRCPEAARNANYFAANAERMRYGRFRQMGLMIGSGVIESGCKQIVTQRLKLPGAQWLEQGALYTAKARAAWLSGQWQTLCHRRARLPLAV